MFQQCYQETKGPRDLCGQIYQFCRKWLDPESNLTAEKLDQMVLEWFLTEIPQEMQSWVRECGAETTSQAVALAEGFLMSEAEDRKQTEQQVPVSFEDVAIRFTDEEELLLSPEQKALHREVMDEIHEMLDSLSGSDLEINNKGDHGKIHE